MSKKKSSKKKNKKKEMAEWSKATDCKSAEFSHRRFKPCFLYIAKLRSMTQVGSVPALGAGRHVFKSHYFDFFFKSANLN